MLQPGAVLIARLTVAGFSDVVVKTTDYGWAAVARARIPDRTPP